jgi:membrane protein implicated in regulation of membrane protease activity
MWKRSEGLFRRFPALRWLYPGMRVKRYALVAALGVLLLALGLAPLLPALPLWPWALALSLLGLLLLVGGIRAMNRSLLSALTEPEEVPERVYVRRRLERGPKVVAFGGGTGLSGCLGA